MFEAYFLCFSHRIFLRNGEFLKKKFKIWFDFEKKIAKSRHGAVRQILAMFSKILWLQKWSLIRKVLMCPVKYQNSIPNEMSYLGSKKVMFIYS